MIKMLSFLAPFGMPIINPKVAHALVDACEALTIVRRDATASDIGLKMFFQSPEL